MAISEIDVLREVALLGECRAHQIQARLSDKNGREEQIGTIFVYLERLTRSGEVTWRIGGPDPNRGNRRPRYYQATDGGRGRLTAAAALSETAQHTSSHGGAAAPQT